MAFRGKVNGVLFNSGREMVQLIYAKYFSKNPNITLNEISIKLENYPKLTKLNDENDRSFLKSKSKYMELADTKKRKFYYSEPFLIEDKEYYLKTETGEPETSEHIRFAKDNNIVVEVETSSFRETRENSNNQSDENDENDSHEPINENFKLIQIRDLNGKKFYIPEYQRGYRWIDEAAYFVKDLETNKKEHYLFQPLVLKKIDNSVPYCQKLGANGPKSATGNLENDENTFELIDGQQRLTTLYLSLTACGVTPNFEIYYERKRVIDNIYTKLALTKINEEVGNKKTAIYDKLDRQAQFVWYVTDKDAKTVFQNINAGKTELTSAELFKALLIDIDNDEKKKSGNSLIAYQFDEVENQLNDLDLWSFISNNCDAETKIDYLLNIYFYGINKSIINGEIVSFSGINKIKNLLRSLNDNVNKNSKFSFLSFNILNEAANENKNHEFLSKFREADKCWEEIYDIFEIIKSWYSNVETYNLVGFLLAAKQKNNVVQVLSDLISLYRNKNNDDFIKEVYKKICDLFVINDQMIRLFDTEEIAQSNPNDEINYKTDSVRCYNLLLLSNIIPAINSQVKFDFKHLKDKYNIRMEHKIIWDIEHIKPKNIKKDIVSSYWNQREFESCVLEQFKILIHDTEYMNGLDDTKIDLLNGFVTNYKNYESQKKELDSIWNGYAEDTYQVDNSITNLVLLSSDINRSYHDDFFGEKAKKIKENDNLGLFIPIITKRVFFKSFSNSDVSIQSQWTENDQNAYRKYLNCVLDYIQNKKINTQYSWRGDSDYE